MAARVADGEPVKLAAGPLNNHPLLTAVLDDHVLQVHLAARFGIHAPVQVGQVRARHGQGGGAEGPLVTVARHAESAGPEIGSPQTGERAVLDGGRGAAPAVDEAAVGAAIAADSGLLLRQGATVDQAATVATFDKEAAVTDGEAGSGRDDQRVVQYPAVFLSTQYLLADLAGQAVQGVMATGQSDGPGMALLVAGDLPEQAVGGEGFQGPVAGLVGIDRAQADAAQGCWR